MADQPGTTKQDDQQTQQNQSQGQNPRSQQSYDSSFMDMIASASPSQGYDVISQVVSSYFDNLESQTRQTRRIADLWAQSLLLHQTKADLIKAVVPIVTHQVVTELQRNPQFSQQ